MLPSSSWSLQAVTFLLLSAESEPLDSSSYCEILSLGFFDPPSSWCSSSQSVHGVPLPCLLGTPLSFLVTFSQGFQLPSWPPLSSYWGWHPNLHLHPRSLSGAPIVYQTSPLWYLTGSSSKTCPQTALLLIAQNPLCHIPCCVEGHQLSSSFNQTNPSSRNPLDTSFPSSNQHSIHSVLVNPLLLHLYGLAMVSLSSSLSWMSATNFSPVSLP